VTWLTWRQQRTETLIAAGILALLAALLVPIGLHMASVYDQNGLAACAGSGTSACHDAMAAFGNEFGSITSVLPWFNLIPGAVGVLLASPLILELESGTFRLAWTQSVTRRRWLAGKLAMTVAAALLAALAMTVLLTWWRTPLDHLHGRMETNVFDFEGIVGFGYVLFALGLALAIGAVWRRAVPALIIAFAGYTVARIVVQGWLRQRYETPLTSTWPMSKGFAGPNLDRAWVLSEQPSDRLGHPWRQSLDVIQLCSRTAGGTLKAIDPACLARHGAGFNHAVYQPASRFWLFQGVETALFGGAAVVLILFAAWWVHERAS
jgi:hypothetical protein